MEVIQKEINEIVRSCAEDENLRRIVLNVHSMKKDEREIFLKKMNIYFSNQHSSVEAQAYKFFRVLLMDDVRNVIVERLKRELMKGS
jgi:hypothetical protein